MENYVRMGVCVVFFGLAQCAVMPSQSGANAVSVVLQNPQTSYKLNQPVQLHLVISNKSDKDVSVTVAPGYEDATYNCKALVKGPKSAATDEYLEPRQRSSKVHTRSAFGYTLAPNAFLNMHYDLTRKHYLDEPGTYSVKLRCGYFDGASPVAVFSNSIDLIIEQ